MNNVVFYDGECGLCQRSIRFLMTMDQNKILLFAPLNGETYKSLFSTASDMSTVVFLLDGKLYEKSDAILKVLVTLGGWKRLAVSFKLIPKFLRDFIYDFIASRRSKVSCVILVKDSRFLL